MLSKTYIFRERGVECDSMIPSSIPEAEIARRAKIKEDKPNKNPSVDALITVILSLTLFASLLLSSTLF